jgi:hypothetical protein
MSMNNDHDENNTETSNKFTCRNYGTRKIIIKTQQQITTNTHLWALPRHNTKAILQAQQNQWI